MNLVIKQNNQSKETVPDSSIVEKLYNLTKEDVANGITAIATVPSGGLQGWIEVPAAYQDAVDYLNEHFGPNLKIDALSYYIRFYDPEVVRVLIAKGVIQEGEGLTIAQTELLPTGNGGANQSWWNGNTQIRRFDELKYFGRCRGGSHEMGQWFVNATNLESVDLTGFTNLRGFRLFEGCINLRYFHGYGNEPANTLNLVNLTSFNASFAGCDKLHHVTSLGVVSQFRDSTFRNCSNLEDVNLPVQCAQIKSNTFDGCTNLTTINLDNLTNIDISAFKNCVNLEYFSGPNSTSGVLNLPMLSSLGNEAFRGCAKLTTIISLGTITSIGNSAFEGCSLLATIPFPNTLTTIGTNALANTTWYNNQPNGAVIINNKILYKYKGNVGGSYSVPSTIISITSDCFKNDSSLTGVTIPSSVTILGEEVFQNTGLTSIVLPGSITSIGKDLCYGCSNLTSVTISEGITEIPQGMFINCPLTEIELPTTVNKIGSHLVGVLTNTTAPLQKLILRNPNQVVTIKEASLNGVSSTCQIQVPSSLVNSYKVAQYWSNFASQIQAIPT